MWTRNQGNADRFVRVVMGAGLVTVAAVGLTPLGWIGVIPLVTGLAGMCPLYSLLGIRTATPPSSTQS